MQRSQLLSCLYKLILYTIPRKKCHQFAACAAMVTSITAFNGANATNYYVSPVGNNADGSSYATAWSSFTNIVWSKLQAGDVLLIDGGTSGLVYKQSLVVPPNLPSNIQILASNDSGHNGQVVLDGTNSLSTGIDLNSSVCVGAVGPSIGMLVRNFKSAGVQFENTSGGASVWFTEIANNNSGVTVAYGVSSAPPISRLNNAYPGLAGAYITDSIIHDNVGYNVFSDSPCIVLGSWLYESSYPNPGNTTVGALLDYINSPNSPSVYGCVFGPGLSYGLVAGPNCLNLNVGNSLFVNAATANLAIQQSSNQEQFWLNDCTSFLTQLNAQGTGHYSINDQRSNPSQRSLFVSNSIVYGGIVGVPVSEGTVGIVTGLNGRSGVSDTTGNFEDVETGNTTTLVAQQTDPEFSSNVAAISNSVSAATLLNYSFALVQNSPAINSGAAINSGTDLERAWAIQYSSTQHPGYNTTAAVPNPVPAPAPAPPPPPSKHGFKTKVHQTHSHSSVPKNHQIHSHSSVSKNHQPHNPK